MSQFIRKYRETGDRNHLKAHYESEGYLQIYRKPKPKWIAKFQILSDLIDLQPGQRLLDVGCATQMFRPYAERRGGTYEGVDIAAGFSPDYVADAQSLEGVPKDHYDWVVLSDVLEHLPDPAAAFRAAARVSRELLAVVPNLYRLESIPYLPRRPDDRHLVRMSPWRWLSLCQASGWRISHVRGFFYVPSIAFYPLFPLRVADRLLRNPLSLAVSRVIDRRWADRGFLKYLGQELIFTAQRLS